MDETTGQLSVVTCRRILSAAGKHLADEEIERVRDQLYALARIGIAAARRPEASTLFAATLQGLPDDERSDLEERAAIAEFDGKLTRDQAERLALTQHLRPTGFRI